jgi:hypothetical protein
MKVAVIGGGIFGTVIADLLSRSGHEISIFEKQTDLFQGATGNSSNRLHLGFHYPRDLETAVQSLEGFSNFTSFYPDACNFKFPCVYALSESDSKITIEHFLRFLEIANLEAEAIDSRSLSIYGFDTNTISQAWRTQEGVVDVDALKGSLIGRLKQQQVVINLRTEITRVSKRGKWWKIEYKGGEEEFDFVVIATYGVDEIETPDLVVPRSKSIYQATLILQAKLSVPRFGMTVIDGDFITVLPKGFSNTFLIYAPGPSVIAESEDLRYVKSKSKSVTDLKINSMYLRERFRFYFPHVDSEFSDDLLVTIRNLEMSTRVTDKRVSRIEELAPNLVSVRSGKIDHAILIGKELVRLTSSASV